MNISGGTAGNITVYGGALNISGGTAGNITVYGGSLGVSGGTVGNIAVFGGRAAVTAGYIGGAQVHSGTLDFSGGYFAVDSSVSPSVAEGYTVRTIRRTTARRILRLRKATYTAYTKATT